MRPGPRQPWSLPDRGPLNIKPGASPLSNQKPASGDLCSGQVIEYLQNNQPLVAWILEVQPSRVRALNVNQREIKLARSRLLPWTGPVHPSDLSRQQTLDLLQQHHQTRRSIQEAIELLEVWSMAQGEIDRASVDWFAGLVWEDPDPDRVAALGRAMLQARAYFKFVPPDFEVHSSRVVGKKLEEERSSREKERLVSIGREFFKDLFASLVRSAAPPQLPDPYVADRLRELLVRRVKDPDDSQTQEVWTKITTGLPQDPHLPFLLARGWGIYPRHYNFLLVQADYSWEDDWSQAHHEEIEAIKRKLSAHPDSPGLEDLISIDSSSTKDIDDAFSVREHSSGYSLRLALAGPGLFWTIGSGLDRAAAHRASSLYLPEGKSDMLPRVLAEDLFSLNQGLVRPALVLEFELDLQGRIKTFEPRLDRVLVRANRTYLEVEEDLAQNRDASLTSALKLASLLRSKRLEQGAVIIDQIEPVIRLQEADQDVLVHLEDSPACPGAQLIVSELMLLCNSILALWSMDRGIPLLYRTQDIVLPKEYSGVWDRPEDIYQVIRALGATLTETVPRPHRSIGVSAYASVTSPLRRYLDLVNQAQIASVLQGRQPPLDSDDLEKLLPYLNARAGLVGRIQKFRPRYWKLLYFKQQGKGAVWSGVVVDNSGPVVIALPREQILIRAGHEIFGGKTRIGQVFRLRLGKVDPLNNEIHVLEAWEE